MNKKLILLVLIVLLFAASNCYALEIYGGVQISSIDESTKHFNPDLEIDLNYPVLGMRHWVTEEIAVGLEYNSLSFMGDFPTDGSVSSSFLNELYADAYLATFTYKLPTKKDIRFVLAAGGYQTELNYYLSDDYTDTTIGYKIGLESKLDLSGYKDLSIINAINYRKVDADLKADKMDFSGVEFNSVLNFKL